MSEVQKEKILEMKDITVQFPGVLALDKVQIEAYRGEVHVLLGENGAGKSTIMKVLAGVNTVYEGTVILKGEEILCKSVLEQRQRGVSMIFQEMNLLLNLSVAENIFQGRHPLTKTGAVDWNKMYSEARRLLDSINCNISEKEMVSNLSVGQMQMVEIAKALSIDADIIIMDEPTSALTEKEVDALFNVIADLKKRGVAIMYISHRMEEIFKIGDRVTVFRDGKYITTKMIKDTNLDELISLMVGREMSQYYPKVEVEPGEVLLEVKGITRGKVLKGVSFYARRGEITTFYGLMGAGRTELVRAVFGADAFDSGEVYIAGEKVRIKSCENATKHKIALLTEDRKNQGLILDFDLNRNISMANLKKHCTIAGGFDLAKEKEDNIALCNKLTVKTPSIMQKAGNLSGGNQQKVVICKWLNADSEIVIFDEPTRGIDVGAKTEIYGIMNQLKEEGKAVVVVSSELTEAIGISDRMYVMHEGEVTGLLEKKDLEGITEEAVLKFATGIQKNV